LQAAHKASSEMQSFLGSTLDAGGAVRSARGRELLPGRGDFNALAPANATLVDAASGKLHQATPATTQRSEMQNSFGYEMLSESALWEARHRMVRLAMQVQTRPPPPPPNPPRVCTQKSLSSIWWGCMEMPAGDQMVGLDMQVGLLCMDLSRGHDVPRSFA